MGKTSAEKCHEAKFPCSGSSSHPSRANFTLWPILTMDPLKRLQAMEFSSRSRMESALPEAAATGTPAPPRPIPSQANWSGRLHPLLTGLLFLSGQFSGSHAAQNPRQSALHTELDGQLKGWPGSFDPPCCLENLSHTSDELHHATITSQWSSRFLPSLESQQSFSPRARLHL